MFVAGIAGMGGTATFLGIMAAIALALVALGVLIYTKPARYFKENNVPIWKSFVPVYNMWTVYNDIIKEKKFFWFWLPLAILRAVLAIIVSINPRFEGVFGVIYLILFIPALAIVLDDDDFLFLRFYNAVLLDSYAVMAFAAPIAFVVNGFRLIF